MNHPYKISVATVLLLFFSLSTATALQITGGNIEIVFTEGIAVPIDEFDAYFNDGASRDQAVDIADPGNASFIESPADPHSGTVTLSDPIRPAGPVPAPAPSQGFTRTRQTTTLDFDPTDILGSWSASNDALAFAGNTTLGEQIALTSLQRWTGTFGGPDDEFFLLYGDFALRYAPDRADSERSGLVLTSNIDFEHVTFADIANADIAFDGDNLLITGDLLIADGLLLLDPATPLGADFGDFALTASVPEPTALLLITVGGLGLLRRRASTS